MQSSDRLTCHSTNMDSYSSNLMDDLTSAIKNVRSMKRVPPVHIYSLNSEGHGLSAVDVNPTRSHIAYSIPDTEHVSLITYDDYSEDLIGNVSETFLNYLERQNLKEKRRITKNSSSPQTFFIRHTAPVSDVCFSSDSNLLFSCSLEGSVKVFCTNIYRVLQCYENTGYVPNIDVSSDSANFATASFISRCSKQSTVSLFSLKREDPVITFWGHTDAIKCVKFHPNGLYIATASCDKTIRLWNANTVKEVRKLSFEGCQDYPEKLAFSPDGKHLASTYSDSVKIWDVASGKILKCLETTDSAPNFLNISYNQRGNILAAGGLHKKLFLWNVENYKSPTSKPEDEVMKCATLAKRIYSVKYTTNCFTCATA